MSKIDHLIGELRAAIDGMRSGAQYIHNPAVRNLVEQETALIEEIVNRYDETTNHHPAGAGRPP